MNVETMKLKGIQCVNHVKDIADIEFVWVGGLVVMGYAKSFSCLTQLRLC